LLAATHNATRECRAKSGTKLPHAYLALADIISDNLDKAAASADQILEVVNKEAGLMVELKRLLAQEASERQILEEADLTDGAVAERLRSDLRARVLATRSCKGTLLVPRLNPDSDLGQSKGSCGRNGADARAAASAAILWMNLNSRLIGLLIAERPGVRVPVRLYRGSRKSFRLPDCTLRARFAAPSNDEEVSPNRRRVQIAHLIG